MEASEAFPFHPLEVVGMEQNLLPYPALVEQAKPEAAAAHTYSTTKSEEVQQWPIYPHKGMHLMSHLSKPYQKLLQCWLCFKLLAVDYRIT